VAEEQVISAASVIGMLGIADRGVLFDLMEAVMAGRPAEALAITDRAYALGADLGALLGDLLDLTHTLSRLKAVPELRQSQELPEAERTRGAALADKLSVPVLGRTWQMLLKGVAEVEQAPDRRAAAEMVLIRLCHVADLPTPGELVRKLQANASASPTAMPGSPAPSGGGGPARAALAIAQPQQAAPPSAAPKTFREVVALASAERELVLHGHLLHSVHLVRFAPPVIELRPQPDAPRDLAPKLGALLLRATGTRWTIAISAAAGDPTLAEQGNEADRGRRDAAAEHPLVRAILEAFPGARISSVQAPGVDSYGLTAEISFMEPGEPSFTPDDPDDLPSEPPEFMDIPIEADPRFLTETAR
jgi:DNA polymerase-3 subunit gamma/tau